MHAPLTRWAPLSKEAGPQERYAQLKQDVQFCFEVLQLWMGQHAGESSPSSSSSSSTARARAAQLLQLVLDNKDVRDELYVLFMKQMTQNPVSGASYWLIFIKSL